MLKLKQIIEDNYKSIVDRGLISPSTSMHDFTEKLYEEVNEFQEATMEGTLKEIKEELSDVVLVCFNIAKHYGFDIENSLKDKIEVNKKRALRNQ